MTIKPAKGKMEAARTYTLEKLPKDRPFDRQWYMLRLYEDTREVRSMTLEREWADIFAENWLKRGVVSAKLSRKRLPPLGWESVAAYWS